MPPRPGSLPTPIIACGRTPAKSGDLVSGDAASRVYVAPGSKDELYAFLSGGFSGQVAVYGIPSGRLLKVIPVFSQNPENAWVLSENPRFAVIDVVAGDARYLVLTRNPRNAGGDARDRSNR